MGPQNGEPVCPCAMRAAGLETAPLWTDAKREQLRDVLRKVADADAMTTDTTGF